MFVFPFYFDTKISYWIFNIKNRTIWGLPKSCTWAARIGSNKSWNLALVWLGLYFIETAWFSRIWHNVFRFNSSFLKLYLKGQIAMESNTEFLNYNVSLRGPYFSWNFLCAKLHKSHKTKVMRKQHKSSKTINSLILWAI